MTWKEILKEAREAAERETHPPEPMRWISINEKPKERPPGPMEAPVKWIRIGVKDQGDDEGQGSGPSELA